MQWILYTTFLSLSSAQILGIDNLQKSNDLIFTPNLGNSNQPKYELVPKEDFIKQNLMQYLNQIQDFNNLVYLKDKLQSIRPYHKGKFKKHQFLHRPAFNILNKEKEAYPNVKHCLTYYKLIPIRPNLLPTKRTNHHQLGVYTGNSPYDTIYIAPNQMYFINGKNKEDTDPTLNNFGHKNILREDPGQERKNNDLLSKRTSSINIEGKVIKYFPNKGLQIHNGLIHYYNGTNDIHEQLTRSHDKPKKKEDTKLTKLLKSFENIRSIDMSDESKEKKESSSDSSGIAMDKKDKSDSESEQESVKIKVDSTELNSKYARIYDSAERDRYTEIGKEGKRNEESEDNGRDYNPMGKR